MQPPSSSSALLTQRLLSMIVTLNVTDVKMGRMSNPTPLTPTLPMARHGGMLRDASLNVQRRPLISTPVTVSVWRLGCSGNTGWSMVRPCVTLAGSIPIT